jgi:hypothetical protein
MDRRMPFAFETRDELLFIIATGVIRLEDATVLEEGVGAYLAANPGRPARVLADCTHFRIYAPDAADALLELMKRDNMRLDKAAFVVGEGTGALQTARMIRDAKNDRRRLFFTMQEALRWLKE